MLKLNDKYYATDRCLIAPPFHRSYTARSPLRT